jgi:hypothetical protein
VEPNFSAWRLFSSQLSALTLLNLSPFQDLTHLGVGLKTAIGKESFSSKYKGVLARQLPTVTVVPRSQDPKRPLRSLKLHAKTKSLYSGLSLGSPTSTTQRVCTESPKPHPGRVFIGEGQEAGLPILEVNRLDVIQVRGSWHIGIGFYSIVS